MSGARQLVWKDVGRINGVCAVDVTELKTERWVRLPYPSEATGMSFDEAAQKIGGDERVEYTSRPQ